MPETLPLPETGESAALDAYSRIVVDVAERVTPSVANLRVTRRGRGGRLPAGAGSGVALTPDGFLLTSAHVVAGPGRAGWPSSAAGSCPTWKTAIAAYWPVRLRRSGCRSWPRRCPRTAMPRRRAARR